MNEREILQYSSILEALKSIQEISARACQEERPSLAMQEICELSSNTLMIVSFQKPKLT